MKIFDFHINIVADWVSQISLEGESQSLLRSFKHPKLPELNRMASWQEIQSLPVDGGVCFGYQFQQQELCAKNSLYTAESLADQTKFFGLLNVQPKEKGAVEFLERHLELPQIIGLKLKAKWGGFSLSDFEMLGPCLEVLEKKNKILLVHISQNFHSSEGDNLSDLMVLLENFPRVKVVAAHLAGFAGVYSCFEPMRRKFENLWIDISLPLNLMWLPPLLQNDSLERYLFATDYPYSSVESFVERIEGLGLSTNQAEHVFYKNAENLIADVTG